MKLSWITSLIGNQNCVKCGDLNNNLKSMVKKTILKDIVKRDGIVVPFDEKKIYSAIEKSMTASGELKDGAVDRVLDAVIDELEERQKTNKHFIPTVEGIQDVVEHQLIIKKFSQTAKAYILYRDSRSRIRDLENIAVSEEVKKVVASSKKYFDNQLSEFIYYSMYSRWQEEKGRREAWTETIDRYIDFMKENLGKKLSSKEYNEIRDYMLEMRAMGSMRLLWAAGNAARATNVCVYNCSFIAPALWKDFGEIMYISMCGTGVGFSAERQTVEMLPIIRPQTGKKPIIHSVEDSKEGWANAFVLGLEKWSEGGDVVFDFGQLRPKGAKLKTMGGRSSGPDPLKSLLEFTREKMLSRQRRHLTTLDVHDIVCKIGEIVVAGGVRRSALISLSDLDDQDMREAKNGQFYLTNPQRSMANNSAVYNEKPTMAQFIDEWANLAKSGTGERGIFNRGGLKDQIPERRWEKFEKDAWNSGINPCGEIILKSKQFCNLSEVVARSNDTEKTLLDKVRVATILGTYQASLTNFKYLSKEWKKNCEEEALLGVSITGQWDSKVSRDPKILEKLKKMAINTNKKYAKKLGINPATAITCVKPSGNGSQLFNCSSGMHPRHAEYYIRRVRIESHNPLFELLKEKGVPYSPEVGQSKESASTYVVEFPIRSPKGSILKKDIASIDQLKHWEILKKNYCEHNPSVTVSIEEDKWLAVGDWVYEHWNNVGGLSFLPRDDHVYQLAPYEEISADEYSKRIAVFPNIDFSELALYEHSDVTTGAKELACVAGLCEI